MLDFWPGSSFVDYVGLTVLVNPLRDADVNGLPLSFEDLFASKYKLVERFNLPVLVTELGIPGRAETQAQWLDAAKDVVQKYSLLTGLVYFNALSSRAATDPTHTQLDWRLSNWTLIPDDG